MSMSDREIWIPPVPALSDIGAYKQKAPACRGFLFCFGVAVQALQRNKAQASTRRNTKSKGRQSPDYRPLRYPIARAAGPCSNSSLCAHVAMPRQVQ
ncbi:hypothetical protein XbrCFBP1976_17805 [Xanthomonas bromi]|uniref:Uncharacterized protein n=1 Tax=Xanthomonas bromi TaxID=56449 RepID=A0ABX5BMT5_9XANT|nr:hypothetical protein XbrCFBP1976_17805 [Xanthomonas bromi]